MSKRTKRRSAWASITEVRRGEVYRIRYWAKGPDGQYKRRSKTIRGTRLDAERRRSELMLDHSEDAPCPTVAQAWERWVLPSYERRVDEGGMSAHTLVQYRGAWRNHVSPTWADVPLDSVRPLRVQQWLSSLSWSAANQGVKVLSAVMDAAVRFECVEHNPMRERYLMPPKSTVRPHDAGIWTLPELYGVWRSVRGSWVEPALILAAFGGCRVGESLGVLAGEVELREVGGVDVALVSVARQVDKSGAVIDALKTAESRRVAVVAGRAALRLSELADVLPPDWYLTHDGAGAPQAQARLMRQWKAMGQAHPFRNLRNSWQTWMRWDAGLPPYYIEPLMGHRLAGVTGQHYDRPTAEVLAGAVARAYAERPWDAGWEEMGREDG